MLDIFGMIGNYEERKIANTKVGRAVIDTCRVSDTEAEYETGIKHPQYNDGKWIIVEEYYSEEEAKKGHEKWVAVFKKGLPEELRDVSTTFLCRLIDLSGEEHRVSKKESRKKKEKKL